MLKRVILHASLIVSLITASYFYLPFGRENYTLLLAAIWGCIAAATALAALQRRTLLVASVVGLVAVLALWVWRFQDVTNVPANYNAIAGYGLVLLFVVYALFAGSGDEVLQAFERYSRIYVVLYVLAAMLLVTGAISNLIALRPLVIFDVSRDPRLYIAHGPVLFLGYLGVDRFIHRSGNQLRNLFDAGIAITAVVMSASRVFTIVALVMLALVIFVRRPKIVGFIAFGLMLSVTSWLFMNIPLPGANPFEALGSDRSGFIRYLTYFKAREQIIEHWGLGVGIPSAATDQATWLSVQNFSESDLGMVGILFTFGVLGVVAYYLSAWLACSMATRKAQGETFRARALAYCCAALALYGVISPSLWYGGGTIAFAIALGQWANRRYYQNPTLRTTTATFPAAASRVLADAL